MYLPGESPVPLRRFREDRIMYGTDFPNIPFAWDRELKCIQCAGLSVGALARVVGRNAMAFFGMEAPA